LSTSLIATGQTVTKGELARAVWSGTVVGDDAVTNAIIKLRRAFGDDSRSPKVIETIPKLGYRLVAKAQSLQIEEGQADSDVPPVGATADGAGPRTEPPTIAVLPFRNLSGDPEQEFFADGMAEDIITGLSRYRWFFVIARTSSFTYKGRAIDVKQVAQDSGVRYVLEGSVRKAGRRVRVTAQLIDATAGTHIWAERYERELEDIFAVQDEITEAIVAAIAPEIGDVERERAQRKPPGSLDAWSPYQRGLAGYHSSTEGGFRSAIEQFDRVNEIDPTFAPAFAMAAGARAR
jgi:TolB-like protein